MHHELCKCIDGYLNSSNVLLLIQFSQFSHSVVSDSLQPHDVPFNICIICTCIFRGHVIRSETALKKAHSFHIMMDITKLSFNEVLTIRFLQRNVCVHLYPVPYNVLLKF